MDERGELEGLAAWMTFLQTHALVVEVLGRELETERGLPLGWFEVLMFLANAPEGKMRMQDLAGSVLLSKSGVTRLVDRIEEAGLVERAACEDDRRVTYAAITPVGRRTLREAAPVHLRGVDSHFGRHLTATELRTLRAILRKVLEGNGRLERDCPSQPAGRTAAPARTG